jgi:hypothetical protein
MTYAAEELPAVRRQRRPRITWECKIIPDHAMKAYESSEKEVQLHLFLTSPIDVCGW